MDKFTARTALLAGVHLIRRRPWLVLSWAAVLLVRTIASAAATRELMAIARAGVFSGRPAGSFNGQLLAFSLVEAALSLLIAAVLWTSAFRAMLRPEDRRALGFGAEELCVFVVWLLTQVIVLIAQWALPFLIISRVVALDARSIAYLVAAIGVLGLYWTSVAAVWAFACVRIAPLRCWTIARGRFWLLSALVVGVGALDRLARAGVVQLAAGIRHLFPPGRLAPSEPFGVAGPSLMDAFQPPILLQDVLMAGVGALQIAFIAAIVASAYRTRPQAPEAAAAGSVMAGGPAR